MHVENKRIFIGNLPPNIDEKEVKKQFSQYGNIISIDIKQRKNNINNNVSPFFAFVNLEIDNKSIQKCFYELSNCNWQGYYPKLELAKESFLDRLKREREEAQLENLQVNSPIISQSKNEYYISNTSNKKIYHSSSESDEEQSFPKQNGSIHSTKTTSEKSGTLLVEKDHTLNEVEKVSENQVELNEENDNVTFVIKNNKHKVKENALKIESVINASINTVTVKCSEKDKKSLEADAKRKQSLIQMRNTYNQQKSLIKNALSKIDTKQNKIIFDDNTDQQYPLQINNDSALSKKRKLALFKDDDDDQEDDINFELKSQFKGKKGEKLLQLQSKFNNDKRFTLDERFQDDDQEEDTLEVPDDDEKSKQLEILETVLGKKVRNEHINDKQGNIPKGMIRFDPSKPEHSKFEIKRNEISKKDKKKEKLKENAEDPLPPPEVSKEKFYQVKSNLKESLKETEGFSLLSMFGRAEEKDEIEETPMTSTELKKSKRFDLDQNNFKCESFDIQDKSKQKQEKLESQPFKWSESFFFTKNDSRLIDGLKFLANISKVENSEEFSEKRKEIARITQKKIKNKVRDKYKFQQKMRKRIKIKKAKKL